MMKKFTERLKKAMGNKGFTLVELVIVVAILAALVGILAPQYTKYVEKSRVAADAAVCEDVLRATQTLLADEEITVSLIGTVVISSGDMTITGDGLKTELKKVIPEVEKMKLKSKLHTADGATESKYTITVAADATTKDISVTGAWGK